MKTNEFGPALAGILAEITTGTPVNGGFVLNGGDHGLLASLDQLSATDASRSSQGGATVAAHAAHLAFGLSLLNRWATEGGNPFAGAHWYEAWQITAVDGPHWQHIRDNLRKEAGQWQEVLYTPREVAEIELKGMFGSVAHLAYHLGAIRQILAQARGPKDHSG
ncbi:MAG: hypothetical protein KBF80_11755 [Flavobacteriales bacterium]|nr:hypothetical protein [Flavobacteriales bacterium]